jgi:hypothetical protein
MVLVQVCTVRNNIDTTIYALVYIIDVYLCNLDIEARLARLLAKLRSRNRSFQQKQCNHLRK